MALPYARYNPALGQLEVGPGLAGGAYPFLRGAASTSGAETRLVLSKPLPVGGALWFSARALAKTPDGANVAALALVGRAGRTALGVAVSADSLSAAVPPSLSGAALLVAPSDGAVAVLVSGAAGAEILWRVTLAYDEE